MSIEIVSHPQTSCMDLYEVNLTAIVVLAVCTYNFPIQCPYNNCDLRSFPMLRQLVWTCTKCTCSPYWSLWYVLTTFLYNARTKIIIWGRFPRSDSLYENVRGVPGRHIGPCGVYLHLFHTMSKIFIIKKSSSPER